MPVDQLGPHARIHPPRRPINADVAPPASKSLTNRYLTCATLADGWTTLEEVSLSDDVQAMLDGLTALGVRTEYRPAARELRVQGTRGSFPLDEAEIDVGNAGTAMRFLTALVSLGYGRFGLDGSLRMRQRPIGPLVDALRELGAQIGYRHVLGFPPLNVLARGLRGGEVVFHKPPSSQFVSALLMVAPYAHQDVLIRINGPLVSRPYVEMTLHVMRAMGVEIVVSDDYQRFIVPALQPYQAGSFRIEPDASGATYLWAAAAITGGRVRVPGLTRQSPQGDVRFVDVLAEMGCDVREEAGGLAVQGPAGRLRGVTVDLNEMPDAVQTLAVVALFADGPTTITNVANLRIKETDRLAALETELTKLGARAEAVADGLTIHPPSSATSCEIDTYDDHRMAMSFALAGLVIDGLLIRDADCTSKSFPGFFQVLDAL